MHRRNFTKLLPAAILAPCLASNTATASLDDPDPPKLRWSQRELPTIPGCPWHLVEPETCVWRKTLIDTTTNTVLETEEGVYFQKMGVTLDQLRTAHADKVELVVHCLDGLAYAFVPKHEAREAFALLGSNYPSRFPIPLRIHLGT